GKGLDIHHSITDPQAWTTYQYAMLELARTAAPIVARLVPVPSGAKCLLDLGGGHGLFGATICRRHPPLRSIVLDLPSALEPARQLARKVGIDDIVEYRAANLLEDSLGQGADVVLLSNIVHHFSPEQNADLLIRVYSAMNPGGTVAIWDSERRPPNARAEVASDAASLYFRLTSTSQVTTAKEYETWLRNAGFLQVRSRRSLRAPVNIMTIGKR
ncbi:MAG TPA: methyltransferase, partial [Acidobacteriota bacterium]|nr:methyltransferase [Acidobacteriota bacterium]